MSPPATIDLGYSFEPPCERDDPCHRRLTVWLREMPTERHFDPQRVICQAASGRGGSELLTIQHPWSYVTDYCVYPGRIALKDRLEKEVSAFSFGAELQIEPGESTTVCRIASPAPLFLLSQPDSPASAFAAEVEVILAKRRALWERRADRAQFEDRLAAIAPLSLYCSCLVKVEEELQALAGDGEARLALRFARRQQRELAEAGHWPARVIPVDEAL